MFSSIVKVCLLEIYTKSASVYSLPVVLYILITVALGYNALRASLTSDAKTYENPFASFTSVHNLNVCACPCVCAPLKVKLTAACAVSQSPIFLV